MRNRFMCRDMPFIVVIKQTLKLLKLLIVTDFASHRIQILLRLFGTRQISIEDRHEIRVLGIWLVFWGNVVKGLFVQLKALLARKFQARFSTVQAPSIHLELLVVLRHTRFRSLLRLILHLLRMISRLSQPILQIKSLTRPPLLLRSILIHITQQILQTCFYTGFVFLMEWDTFFIIVGGAATGARRIHPFMLHRHGEVDPFPKVFSIGSVLSSIILLLHDIQFLRHLDQYFLQIYIPRLFFYSWLRAVQTAQICLLDIVFFHPLINNFFGFALQPCKLEVDICFCFWGVGLFYEGEFLLCEFYKRFEFSFNITVTHIEISKFFRMILQQFRSHLLFQFIDYLFRILDYSTFFRQFGQIFPLLQFCMIDISLLILLKLLKEIDTFCAPALANFFVENGFLLLNYYVFHSGQILQFFAKGLLSHSFFEMEVFFHVNWEVRIP